ncbi:hypothetical protein [Marinobacterium sp. LSUCC0821]|uniref:hypothetical protein n=1 Tax=Marinobacterium sp. LSUCC0821 TaxID=2668067 RepID=UPI001451A577|nr:hypothetical protein [Marinobacterium sp. LSUCC0821]QJD71894.1 hypothetical protein HH196_09390 [Marinobacterium sp. LSUCC0821]
MSDSLQITRFTTEYSPEQDRIRMVIETAEGEKRVIWLTYRLLNRLIEAMVKALEQETSGVPESSNLQGFSQERARQKQVQEPPVLAEQNTPEWLVNRVDLTVSPEKLDIVLFKDEARASLPMPRMNARQWLGIVRQLFTVAQWHSEHWPTWIAQPNAAPKQVVH